METLAQWLERQYLEWQLKNGRISLAKWANYLGLAKGYLSQLMNGVKVNMTMQTAYQIAERLDDFKILEILGYPVPDAPLADLPDAERAAILGWLESVKLALDAVPDAERMVKLNEILDGLPEADTDTK